MVKEEPRRPHEDVTGLEAVLMCQHWTDSRLPVDLYCLMRSEPCLLDAEAEEDHQIEEVESLTGLVLEALKRQIEVFLLWRAHLEAGSIAPAAVAAQTSRSEVRLEAEMTNSEDWLDEKSHRRELGTDSLSKLITTKKTLSTQNRCRSPVLVVESVPNRPASSTKPFSSALLNPPLH